MPHSEPPHDCSERRRRTRGDHFAHASARVREAVGTVAFEVVGVTRPKRLRDPVNGQIESTGKHQPALFSLMPELVLARGRSRLIALMQELDRLVAEIGADLSIGHPAVRDLRQLRRTEDDLAVDLLFVAEELTETHGNAVEHLLQHADGRVQLATLDERNGRVRDARSPRQFPLGEPIALANGPQALPGVVIHQDAHPDCSSY